MVNFTSNTYQMKREIFSFFNKISRNLSKPERKFMADMNYGSLASGSCLLTSGKFNGYPAEIDGQAQERLEQLIEGMKHTKGITEQLKAAPYLSFSMRCKPLEYGVLTPKSVTYSIQLSQSLDFLNSVQYNMFEQRSMEVQRG